MANYGYIKIYSPQKDKPLYKIMIDVQHQLSFFQGTKIDKFFKNIYLLSLYSNKDGLDELLNTVKENDNIYVVNIFCISKKIRGAIKLITDLHQKGINIFSFENPETSLYYQLSTATGLFEKTKALRINYNNAEKICSSR